MSHGGFLRQHSGDAALASHVMHDYTQAGLDPQTRGMLDFAVKLTATPWAMTRADVEALRALGLTDEQVLSVVLITCNFNFMSRLANGLGVELGPGRQEQVESWLSPEATSQTWLMTAKEG